MKVAEALKSKGREVITTKPSDPIPKVMEQLIDKKIGCLPVVQEGELIGLITETDVLSQYLKS